MAQSTTPLISFWHLNVTYDFTLRIGKEEYSTDLVKVEIRTSINTPYPNIILDVFIDPRDLLVDSLFGQQPIKFIIRLKGKEATTIEEIVFDLMYLKIEGQYYPAQQSFLTDQEERSVVSFSTVPINAYKTMSTIVNSIYYNSTPKDIIEDLISKNTKAETIYDQRGQSKLGIDQLIIPPSTIYQVVNYLDRTYGIFDGPLGFYCTFDNKVKLINLARKVDSAQRFTVYLIATDRDNKDIFDRDDPNFFYSKQAVENTYNGNAVMSVKAPTIRYITKPRDTLFKNIDIYLPSFIKNYGVIEKNNKQIYFNEDAIDLSTRITYKKDQTGYDDNQTFIHSTLGKYIYDMSNIVVYIDGNLPTLNLMEVGEHVKIVSHVDDHLKLGGAYILKGSHVQFMKANAWESAAKIFLSRSNVASQ